LSLREIFIDWLTSSRYVEYLEKSGDQLRDDFSARLSEKDVLIRSLRIELAAVRSENERMRLVLMPLGSPAGALYAAKFQAQPASQAQPTLAAQEARDWQGELSKMLKEEEDGIRSRGRIQEHEPRADDGA